MSEKLLRCLISTTCRRSTHIIQTTSMRGMLIFSQQELHFLVPLNTEQVVWQCSTIVVSAIFLTCVYSNTWISTCPVNLKHSQCETNNLTPSLSF